MSHALFVVNAGSSSISSSIVFALAISTSCWAGLSTASAASRASRQGIMTERGWWICLRRCCAGRRVGPRRDRASGIGRLGGIRFDCWRSARRRSSRWLGH